MNRLQLAIKTLFGGNFSRSFYTSWFRPGDKISTYEQLEAYKGYVYTTVSAIAEDTGSMQVELFRRVQKGDKIDLKPVVRHPFLDLLRRPNPDMSQFELLELTQTYMELCGEAFWYLVPGDVSRRPTSFIPIRPDLVVSVAVDEDDPLGTVTGYIVENGKGERMPFDRDEILHFKKPNPIDPYRGVGTVQAALTYIQTEEAASKWTRNAIHNVGRPSGIVGIDGTIGDKEYQEFKENFTAEVNGVENAGKTLFIRNAQKITFQKLGMELSEINLEGLKNLSRDDIMAMWRVSKTMLGIGEGVKMSSSKENRAVWMENVVTKKMHRLVDTIEAKLIDRWGDQNLVVDYVDPSPAFHEDAREDFKAGGLTLNEYRTHIGEDEVANGDVRFMPINIVPVAEDETPQDRGAQEDTSTNSSANEGTDDSNDN